MKGIILASHGKLADGMMDTLKMFSGDIQQADAICFLPGEDMKECLDKLEKAIDAVDTGDGVVVFCDLLFGSPCNCSGKLLGDSRYAGRVNVITGMNLPMIMEYETARTGGMKVEEVIETGQKGIVDFNAMLASR